jgi:type II secretion system protein I
VTSAKGFTLIEALVALLIVSLVLTSASMAIGGFVDQRTTLQSRFLAQSVAWNQIMEIHRYHQGWTSFQDGELSSKGQEELLQGNWNWEYREEPTSGQNMYRQTIEVYGEQATPEAALTMFQVK